MQVNQAAIDEFCRKWRVVEMAFFGSVLRDDFGPSSDVDVLVAFAPGAGPSLAEWLTMEEELARILGRPVDLVERHAVEASENYIRRRNILRNLEPVHVAR
jgi:predicted nucleotidyltransferase